MFFNAQLKAVEGGRNFHIFSKSPNIPFLENFHFHFFSIFQ